MNYLLVRKLLKNVEMRECWGTPCVLKADVRLIPHRCNDSMSAGVTRKNRIHFRSEAECYDAVEQPVFISALNQNPVSSCPRACPHFEAPRRLMNPEGINKGLWRVPWPLAQYHLRLEIRRRLPPVL